MSELTSHERREQERIKREEEQRKAAALREARERRKSYINLALVLLVLISFAAGMGYLATHKRATYTDREVHWHARVDIELCGQKMNLPDADSSQVAHGEAFTGTPLMHSHDDNVIHVEGRVQKKEDITLGAFFDSIDVPFAADRIMNMTNGDECDGVPGKLSMYVNDQPRTDFRNYVIAATNDENDQVIKLVFSAPTAPPGS